MSRKSELIKCVTERQNDNTAMKRFNLIVDKYIKRRDFKGLAKAYYEIGFLFYYQKKWGNAMTFFNETASIAGLIRKAEERLRQIESANKMADDSRRKLILSRDPDPYYAHLRP